MLTLLLLAAVWQLGMRAAGDCARASVEPTVGAWKVNSDERHRLREVERWAMMPLRTMP